MTPEEIKRELERRGWTISSFAEQLGVGVSTLRNALAGHTPMTKALENHISLALGKREAIMVYRVDIDSKKVEELTAGRGCVTEADHKAALDAIIHSNLQELIRLGATLDWTPEERRALGLPPADASSFYGEVAQTLAAEEKVMADYVEQFKAAAPLSADELREMERLQVAPVAPAAAAGEKRAEAKGERSLEEKFAAVTKQYTRVVRQEGDRVVVEFGSGPDPSLLKKKKPFVRRRGHKALKWDFSESGKKQD